MRRTEEARDREITLIHTGGQTGPRWRASLGKVGPKDSRFRAFVPRGCFASSHVFSDSAFDSSRTRGADRASPIGGFLRPGNPRAAQDGGPSFSCGPRSSPREGVEGGGIVPSGGFSSVSPGFLVACLDERLGHVPGRDSANGKQEEKTGRFGPIGPETAQCQLPHNIVTFSMVRARDVRVCAAKAWDSEGTMIRDDFSSPARRVYPNLSSFLSALFGAGYWIFSRERSL